MSNRLSSILFILAFLAGTSSAIGQTVSCVTYLKNYNDDARVSFSYGYLEGVEAALTKDILDVLVPPTDHNHPVWWVVPAGVTSYSTFAERLTSACKKQSGGDMTKTALSIAFRQDGWPKVGMWVDKKRVTLAESTKNGSDLWPTLAFSARTMLTCHR